MSREVVKALRDTRTDIAARLHELVPELGNHGDALRAAIREGLAERGTDPATVAPVDINRVERHAIVARLGAEQRDILISGEGAEQHFAHPKRGIHTKVFGGQPKYFVDDVTRTLAHGRDQLAKRYSNRRDPARRWWPDVNDRFNYLGQEMVDLLTDKDTRGLISSEGRNLDRALTSTNLGRSVLDLITFVNKHPDQYSVSEGVAVAHDLAYLLSTKAKRSILDFTFTSDIARLEADISTTDGGKYAVDRTTATNWNQVFGVRKRETPLPTTTLNCPYHTAPLPDQTDTSLTSYVHASVNMAVDYRLFTDE